MKFRMSHKENKSIMDEIQSKLPDKIILPANGPHTASVVDETAIAMQSYKILNNENVVSASVRLKNSIEFIVQLINDKFAFQNIIYIYMIHVDDSNVRLCGEKILESEFNYIKNCYDSYPYIDSEGMFSDATPVEWQLPVKESLKIVRKGEGCLYETTKDS